MRKTNDGAASLDYDIRLDTVLSGFEPGQERCWVHPRAGVVRKNGETAAVVMTMTPSKLSGSDIFYAMSELRTDDMGRTWTGPVEHAELGRHQLEQGVQEVISDFTPAWHEASGKLLGIGHTVAYKGDDIYRPIRRTAYAVYDADAQRWSDWRGVEMPAAFFTHGAGSTQRFDLENGDILLPIYYAKSLEDISGGRLFHYSAVARCRFDGETLRYIEHGTELTVHRDRGYVEPSITRFGGEFFLTLRADHHGAVARSADGLHFGEPQVWTWDDGTEVPTYNTQQHWVTHSSGLFLVYTRKAENNGHVPRHRAPLFMAQVDPERLCLLRHTERILVPERGAKLCNFGVVDVNERETWVTVAEWMQNGGASGKEMMRLLRERFSEEELAPLADTPYMSGLITKLGADNSVFAARILWDRPNRYASG